MEYKKGELNEVIGTALHVAGWAAGKIAGKALKGAKKGKASFKREVQKSKNFDAQDALRKSERRKLDKMDRKKKGVKPTATSKKTQKTIKTKDKLRANIKASEDVLAKEKEKKEEKMKKGSIDEVASFNATYVTEGFKKTERQYKKAHKEGDMKRMVKLAKKHKKQKDKSLDRKAKRDVAHQSEQE